jgi:hypothetical protein
MTMTSFTYNQVQALSYARYSYGYACGLVHSELSWWGLKSSLHLHVAHTHYGSHYSFKYFIKLAPKRECADRRSHAFGYNSSAPLTAQSTSRAKLALCLCNTLSTCTPAPAQWPAATDPAVAAQETYRVTSPHMGATCPLPVKVTTCQSLKTQHNTCTTCILRNIW